MISFRYFALRIACRLGFGQRDRDVACILHDVAESLELGFQSGNAHGRGPHVDAAARLAEVERHADDADLLGLNVL